LDPLVLDLNGVPFFPEFRAVLWRKSGIVNFGTLDGGYESVANAVNEDGQVVGLFTNTIPDANSIFFGIGYQTRAFGWKDGIMQDLDTLGGTNAQAMLINERGQVVGESYLNSIPSPQCAPMPATGAFLWESGKMQNLGSLGGTSPSLLISTSADRSSAFPVFRATRMSMRSCGRTAR
jgi:probable HAF family extracellular repeat protein